MPRRVDVAIDRLVLDGVEADQRERFTVAFASELRRRLAAVDPDRWATGATHRRAPTISVRGETRTDRLAARVAAGVARSIVGSG
jgi:hypothetical protein